eukprot:13114636-Alexandrium_andersonii.AAC.1
MSPLEVELQPEVRPHKIERHPHCRYCLTLRGLDQGPLLMHPRPQLQFESWCVMIPWGQGNDQEKTPVYTPWNRKTPQDAPPIVALFEEQETRTRKLGNRVPNSRGFQGVLGALQEAPNDFQK